jgi:peptidoglycan/xylan/chitin deacetylase (PgdA/CDA1 family)
MDTLKRLCVPIRADSREALLPGRVYAAVTFDDGFVSVLRNALPELQLRRIPSTIFVPTACLGAHPAWIDSGHPDQQEIVASAQALRDLTRDRLVTIGSHSKTHPDFRGLDDTTAALELGESKEALTAILGRRVTLFSFPHGGYDQRCCELARQAGYEHVFTIEPGLARQSPTQFVIGRVRVDCDDWPLEFQLKVIGSYRWVSRAGWKRKLTRQQSTQAPHPATGYSPGEPNVASFVDGKK